MTPTSDQTPTDSPPLAGGTTSTRPSAPSPASREALQRIWEDNRRWVAAILLVYKPRYADLEDLLQDVAATLVSHVHDLREASALKPWLRAVAINAARMAGRRGSLRQHLSLDGDLPGSDSTDGPADAAPPDRNVAGDEDAQRVMTLAARLDDGYREPLLLKAVHGLSYRQIGQILGLPETTVETRIARARKQLRELAFAADAVTK
jgi:RNA polymerase sigma-70 factor (ECF subfamily)